MKKITLLFTIALLPFLGFSQNVTYDFNTTDDTEGFTAGGATITVPDPGGVLVATGWTGGFQQVRTPEGLNLTESNYAVLRLVVENATNNDSWQVINYDTGNQSAGDGEKFDFTMDVVAEGSGFTTIDVTIPTNPDNAGTIDRVGIRAKQGNTFGLTGTLKIDKLIIVRTFLENSWVSNPDFELVQDWTAAGGESDASYNTTFFTDGSQSGQLTFNADQTSNQFLENSISNFGKTVNPGELNTTFWVRSNNANVQVQVTFDLFDSGGAKISSNNTATYEITAADTWEEVTFSKAITDQFDQISYRLKVRSQSNAVSGDIVLFDQITANFSYYTLSTKDVAFNKVALYPNPAKHTINIKGFDNLSKVEVFDITGKRVMQNNSIVNDQLNVSSLRAGLYLLKLYNNENSSLTKKVIIAN